MPYERDLRQVVDGILTDPDVRIAIDTSELNDDYLRAKMAEASDQIWSEASSAIEALDSLEREILAKRKDYDAAIARPGTLATTEASMGCLGGIAIVLLGSGVLKATWQWFLRSPGIYFSSIIALWFVFYLIRLLSFQLRLPRLRRTVTQKLGLDSGGEQLKSLRVTADQAVLDIVRQHARTVINDATQPFFQDRLFVSTGVGTPTGVPQNNRITTGRGLAEVLNPAFEVATKARERILHFINTLPGASIGIAGPRGVGKSTLLWSVCGKDQKGGNQQHLSILTSAPVEYDPRDFLLHLFASVCRQVIERRGGDESIQWNALDDSELQRPQGGVLFPNQRWLGTALISFGLLLAIVAVFLATVIAGSGPDRTAGNISVKNAGTAPATIPASSPKSGTESAGLTDAEKERSEHPPKSEVKVTTAGATTTPQPTQTPANGTLGTNRIISALELKPGGLLQWGLLSLLLGVVLIAFDTMSHPNKHLYPFWLYALFRKKEPPKIDPLVAAAARSIRDIRFQRSYSSGWSGSLKLPIGIESSAQAAVSLAQKQQSLPELVQQFGDFVRLVTGEYSRVIIGIDELDKLQSDEKAQQFLNEIKAIFNIPNCFYLISVSENAISSFERRGLPFRDVFDSAFDDILYVGYFDLAASRSLLARRVIHLPAPFLGLCHVLSGGLPRDLIRVCRSILLDRAAMISTGNDISSLAISLVQTEIKAKLQAVSYAAHRIPLEPHVTNFLAEVARIETLTLAAPIDNFRIKLAAYSRVQDEEKLLFSKLFALCRELECYLYFAVTAAEIFSSLKMEPLWTSAMQAGVIDKLASVRQTLGLSSGIALFKLVELRGSSEFGSLSNSLIGMPLVQISE